MELTINPYKRSSSWTFYSAAIASVIVYIRFLMGGKVHLEFLPVTILVIWLVPLLFFIMDKMNSNRSVTINDKEVICKKTIRKGLFSDSVVIKRRDIVDSIVKYDENTDGINIDKLKNVTKGESYVIRCFLLDVDVVKLALNKDTFPAAVDRYEKKKEKTRRFGIIATIITDVLFGISAFMI